MKNPEQVRRIEELAASKAALDCMERAYMVLARHAGLALPSGHAGQTAITELYQAMNKASYEVALALEWCKK